MPLHPFAVVVSALLFAFLSGCATKPDPTILHPELAVVSVSSLSDDPGSFNGGRGFLITQDGLIVTCLHLIAPGKETLVTTSDGRPMRAEFVQQDKDADLALIRVPGKHLPCLKLFDGDVTPGMHVRVIGRDGISHGLFDHWENLGHDMAITAALGFDDSGAPLLGDDGRVIGVAHTALTNQSPENLATPIWHVLRMMPELAKLQSPLAQ